MQVLRKMTTKFLVVQCSSPLANISGYTSKEHDLTSIFARSIHGDWHANVVRNVSYSLEAAAPSQPVLGLMDDRR